MEQIKDLKEAYLLLNEKAVLVSVFGHRKSYFALKKDSIFVSNEQLNCYIKFEQFEELFSHGVHENLLHDIKNAQLAYDLMWKTANEVSNSIGSILYKIKGFLDNLPEQEDLNKLMEKLPEEWKEVKEKYDDIVGHNKLEGDNE